MSTEIANGEPGLPDPSQINQVVKWVLLGTTEFDVVEAIKENFPGTDAAALMLGAMRHFERASQFHPDIVRGFCFDAARDLYRRMVECGDFAGALRAVKQIQEMARNVPNREDADTEQIEADIQEGYADGAGV
jgi:hypothetical protein